MPELEPGSTIEMARALHLRTSPPGIDKSSPDPPTAQDLELKIYREKPRSKHVRQPPKRRQRQSTRKRQWSCLQQLPLPRRLVPTLVTNPILHKKRSLTRIRAISMDERDPARHQQHVRDYLADITRYRVRRKVMTILKSIPLRLSKAGSDFIFAHNNLG